MFIYFNKLGELTTIIPHGEIVRQGSWFTLNVALDDDVDISDKNMWFRYKRRGSERFTGDTNYQGHFDMIKEGSIPFKSLDQKEATFDLVDGKYYKVFSYKVNTDTGMTAIDGNVEVVFTLVTSDTTGGTEDVKMEGRANIYVEPTYGLHPERGLDLSVSEYATIMQSINQIQNSYKVKNVVVSQSENEVGDIENTITITYNDAKALTFKSMYIEKYLSDALVNTETMDLTITKSNGEVLTFGGITSEKVMAIILENSVKGKTDVVLKTSKDKISTPTDNTTLTSLGIYQCFGAYVINLPSVSKGTISSEQLEILSQNRNAILMMNGIAYTYSMISNGAYSYHHISGSSEDLIYINASTREWTTEHKTFEIGDLSSQIEQLKLDLQKKVDKIETVSVTSFAYIQYTENGEPVQGSLRIMDNLPFSGTLVKRTSNGEITARTPTSDNSVTTKKYVDDALSTKLDKVTGATNLVAYCADKNGVQRTAQVVSTVPGLSTDDIIPIPRYSTNKTLCTGKPVAGYDATPKSYVDSALSTKADLVDGKVPASQLPSYVDDVVEATKICSTAEELPSPSGQYGPGIRAICNGNPTDEASLALLTSAQWKKGCIVISVYESGQFAWKYLEDLMTSAIYITTEDNKTYRYNYNRAHDTGDMVEISSSLALGETSSTAYPGDKGKADSEAIGAIIDGDIKVYSAIHDQGGNVIDETYATIDAVDGKVDRIETSSIDGVYGLKSENSVDPFQTDSVFNPDTQIGPSNIGQYVLQYKTIIGLTSNGWTVPMDSYSITSTSITVTKGNNTPRVAFRFSTSAGKKYVLRLRTNKSSYCGIQYFTSDGTRLGEQSGALYNNSTFTVTTFEQEIAYGMISFESATNGTVTLTDFYLIALDAPTTDTFYSLVTNVLPDTIPLRSHSGNVATGTPEYNNDATPKSYVDSALLGKVDKVTTSSDYIRAYTINANGTQATMNIDASPSNNTIAMRNETGHLMTTEPISPVHCANKQYVDDAVASVSGGANGIGVDSDGYLQLEKDGTAIEGQPKEVQPLTIQSLEDASKKYIHITTPQYDGNEEYLNGVVDTFTDALKTAFGENVDVNNIYYSFVPHVLANSGIATLDSSIHMMTMNANGSFIEFNGLQKFGWFKNITFGDVFTLNDTNSLGFQDEHGAFLMIDFSKIPTESITGLDLKFGEVAVADVGGRVITTTPTEASHAVNLNYANDHYTTKEYVDNRTLQMKVMTQSEYDGLTTKDENTMYIIIG